MKFLSCFLFLGLLLGACSSVVQEGQVSVLGAGDISADNQAQAGENKVQLSMPLEASFMSDYGSFVYHLKYNSYLLELIDLRLQGASEFGPSFNVDGGVEITAHTVWLSELPPVSERGAVQLVGRNKVTLSSFEEFSCTVKKAIVEHREEALIFQLRICSGDDVSLGDAALTSLLENLKLEKL